jgi:hypothetical protein
MTCLSFVLVVQLLAGDPPYQAIITDLQGDVRLKKSTQGSFIPALWGMQLSTGDQLKTNEAAQVSILFASSNMITLGANSAMTISESVKSAGETSTVQNLDPDLSADLAFISYEEKDGSEVGLLAGLRGQPGESIVLLAPRNTQLKTQRPVFKWHTFKEYEMFKISLFNADGRIWTKETNNPFLDYPDDQPALSQGESYFWVVEGENLLDSDKSASISFGILAENNLVSLEEKEQRLSETLSGSNKWFFLGNLYQKNELYQDALEIFHEIAKNHKTAPLPHQILGKIYQRIGLKDRAIRELETAVKLSQMIN